MFWAPKFRFFLDLGFITTLTLLVKRRWLAVSVIGSFFVYLGLMTYFKYFLKPLSLLTILTSWREGLQMGGFAWDMFPRGAAAWLLLALAIKLAALGLSWKASLPRRCAWLVSSVVFTCYVGLYALANYNDPLSYIQSTRGVGRLGHMRGYLGPWFAEWYYLRSEELLNEALKLRRIRYDRLTPIEADIPIHKRLVIVQAESLDTNILDWRAGGVEVTPFLNHVRRASMFYRVRAMHTRHSADADFAALNGVRGSARANPYTIPNYPYGNTTPQLLTRCGYEVYSFHGNYGEFYNRRAAYEKMGFSGIRFRRELEGYGLPADRWGVDDRDVLQLSARVIRTAAVPTCHFIITLTTHSPYTQLPSSRCEIFPDPQTTAERYLNNMRYLDNCLRDYITALGSGTTVVIYADHPTEDFDGFVADRDVGRELEFIPCLIYDTDQDLSKVQKTRNQSISTDGSMNLVDVISYLRRQIERACEPQEHDAAAEAAKP
jgi:phosphoglycerol transferase MdoB-like AlkP superfamily enzyme